MICALLNAQSAAIKRNKGRAGTDPLSSAAGPSPAQHLNTDCGAGGKRPDKQARQKATGRPENSRAGSRAQARVWLVSKALHQRGRALC